MLHLLPSVLFSKILPFNRLSSRQFFFQRILLLVFLAHIILFGCMILSSMLSKKEDKFTILMHQAGATYVLMPLQKKIDQQHMSGGYKNSSVSKKSQVLNYEDYLEKKRLQKGKKNFVQSSKNFSDSKKSLNSRKKSTVKLLSKSKASAIALSPRSNKSLDKQNKNKKNKKHKKNKIKLMQEQKNHQDKTEEVTSVLEQQKLESEQLKSQELTQQNQQSLEQEQNSLEQNSNDTQLSSEALLDDVIFVGYEQFDECVISSKIQQAVAYSWTAPVGIEAGTSCEMKVKVSSDGSADKVEVIKGSGILVYDTSARTALSQVEFPQEVYGKTIRIVLGN